MSVANSRQIREPDSLGILAKSLQVFSDPILHFNDIIFDTSRRALLVQELEDYLGELFGLVVADVVD